MTMGSSLQVLQDGAHNQEEEINMKKWTIEMIMRNGSLTSYLPMPVAANGAMETRDEREALEALEYWRTDLMTKGFEFRLVEWTPVVKEAN